MDTKPEQEPDDTEIADDDLGAEGGDDSPAADAHPAQPADDDSAVGDTDQHSDA